MLSPSEKIKDYEVIAPLGSGGMAMLYLARRRGVGGFSRLVTLKLVHKHLIEDESMVKLFLDEARISAHVAHPNVVHVEEVGQVGDSYFIAMEYVHGVSLAELLARLTERHLRLRPKLCVWLAAQIAEALHAAHEAKSDKGEPLDIVHRDVSPQNVLIGHTGHVKLIDFGIANCQSETDEREARRTVLGKLRYMSPEQLRLERADRRTDVYALGVMLWEMLAGRSLLRCQRFDDERDWTTRENPPPPSKFSPHSLSQLDRVVQKAIAFDPKDRFDSAFQFRAALLRADPSAVQLDAPMVAVLLRSMLGDELDRRRAAWPREVVGELEDAPEITTSYKWSVDELTSDNRVFTQGSDEDEDDEQTINDIEAHEAREAQPARGPREEPEPTLAATPAAIRTRHGVMSLTDSAPGLPPPAAILEAKPNSASSSGPHAPVSEPRISRRTPTPLPQLPLGVSTTPGIGITVGATPSREPSLDDVLASVPELPNDTMRVPPSAATLAPLLYGARTMRAGAVGFACLLSGILLGAYLSRSAPAQTQLARNAVVAPAPRPALPGGAQPPLPAAFALTVHVDDAKILADTAPPEEEHESPSVNEIGARERRADTELAHNGPAPRKEPRYTASRRSNARPAKGKPSAPSAKAPQRSKPQQRYVRD